MPSNERKRPSEPVRPPPVDQAALRQLMAGKPDPSTAFQRRRISPERDNNSVRRTYDLLRASLVANDGDATRAEWELSEALSASRTTVRAALKMLSDEGWLTRRQNSGTRRTPLLILPLQRLFSFPEYPQVQADWPRAESIPVHGQLLESRTLSAPKVVADRLQLPDGAKVLMTEGLLVQESEPIGLTVSYVALPAGQRDDVHVEDPDVVTILEELLGVRIGETYSTLGAVAADAQSAELVGVAVGAPISWVEDVLYDAEGTPAALSHSRYRSDRVTFSLNTSRT